MVFKRTIKNGTTMAMIGERETLIVQDLEVHQIHKLCGFLCDCPFVDEGIGYRAVTDLVFTEGVSWNQIRVSAVKTVQQNM